MLPATLTSGISLLASSALVAADPLGGHMSQRAEADGIIRITEREHIKIPPPEMIEAAKNLPKRIEKRFGADDSINVDVYVHIVSSTQANADLITDGDVDKQIKALNNGFANHFTFTRKDISRNVSHLTNVTDDELLRTTFHTGNRQDLNLYLVENIPNSKDDRPIFGDASWPTWLDATDYGLAFDGVVVNSRTMPGVSNAYWRYNLGATAVHEVGHWLGLFHTFQGGCSEYGDFMDDTNPEANASYSCNKRQSCSQGVEDPIDNFMNYSPDRCLVQFTPGQFARMESFWEVYRAHEPVTPTTNQPQQPVTWQEQCGKFPTGSDELDNCLYKLRVCDVLFPRGPKGAFAFTWDRVRQCMQESSPGIPQKPGQSSSNQQP